VKTALVTGAGSGIGRGVALVLAQMGLRLALVGRDREKLERTKSELSRGISDALVAPCDITDRAAVKAVVERVPRRVRKDDVLICNAGTNVRNRRLEVLEPADWTS